MIRVCLITATIFVVAGCASNAPAELAGDVAETTAVNDSSTTESAPSEMSAAGEIDFMDAPEVEKVASVAENRDEMICKRVRLTGSNRMEKICRPRSEIDATMRDAQNAVREMGKRSAKRGGAN